MSEVVIGPADETDAQRLAAVYRSAYAENERLGFPAKAGAVTAEEVADWIRTATVFRASVEDTTVGGVRLSEPGERQAKLSRLGVHPDWKRGGIGDRLVTHVERIARERGCAVVRLTTPANHPYLVDWYERRGYEVVEPYPLPYREYDEVVMELSL